MRIRQSFCYQLFLEPGQDVGELFTQARKIGYEAMEFWGREERHERDIAIAKEKGLAVASMVGHGTLPDGLIKRENHDRIEAELARSLEYAVKHRIPGLICFAGNRVPGMSDEEAIANCAVGLHRCAPMAEKHGVNLNIEILNSKVDHVGYICDRVDWALTAVQKAASPRVKILFDIYHVQIMQGDLIRSLNKCGALLGHLHTAGNPGRKDLDDQQEINYAAVCRSLATMGYAHYLGHEFWAKGDKIEALRQAYEVCNAQA
jgi:hydroxypyruvate isomerase